MQVIEIDDRLAQRVNEAAAAENRSPSEYVKSALLERLSKKAVERSEEEKIHRFAESYSTFPQRAEEWEIWQDEQVWEEE